MGITMTNTIKKNVRRLVSGLFMLVFMSASLLAYSRARGYRSGSGSSLSQAFDAVIAQLDGGKSSVRLDREYDRFERNARARGVDTCIQSFIDKLDRSSNSTQVPESIVSVREHNTSHNAVNMSIDWVNKYIDTPNQDFSMALNRFKQSPDFGQLALQQVIDLLGAELHLVHHLASGRTGASVQTALDERNRLLQRTIPLAATMYDTIITAATCDNSYNATIGNRTRQGKKLPKALTIYDKKMFLSSLEQAIEQYQEVMRTMQSNLNMQQIH